MIAILKVFLGEIMSECGYGSIGSVKITGSATLVLEPSVLGTGRSFSLVMRDRMLVRGYLCGLLYAENILNTLGELIERKLIASAKCKKRKAQAYKKYIRKPFSKLFHIFILS
jgi:hypothetical protein